MLLRKWKAFIPIFKATTKRLKQMASKELDEINPIKHMVTLTLVSEYPLAAQDRKSMRESQKLKRNKRS